MKGINNEDSEKEEKEDIKKEEAQDPEKKVRKMSNRHTLREMSQAVDSVMDIMRNGVLFEDISESAWEKVNEVQEVANGLKDKILELEKMI